LCKSAYLDDRESVISVAISIDSDGELASLDTLLYEDIIICDTLTGDYEFGLIAYFAGSE
jgi:hypothetical protein